MSVQSSHEVADEMYLLAKKLMEPLNSLAAG